MMERLAGLPAFLSATALFGVALTLAAWAAATWISRRCANSPLANPILISVVLIVPVLLLTATSYESYFGGARLIHFLMGPATVALALPLHAFIRRAADLWLPLSLSLLTGCLVAIASAVLIAWALGGSEIVVLSLAPKSVSTPFAIGIARQIGGSETLAVIFVVITGVLGAVCSGVVFRLVGIDDEAARGFALGVASHAVGTARALQESQQSGAFGALAIGLNGILTALLMPLLLPAIARLMQGSV